jgi:hypothetical protein
MVRMVQSGDDERRALQDTTVEVINAVLALEAKNGAIATDSRSPDQTPKYKRVRLIHALQAIAEFYQELGCNKSLKWDFHHLALALNDLNQGTVDPLLEPIKTGGTKKLNASRVWCARAYVALGIRTLVKTGLTREQAAKQAARKFPAIRKLAQINRRMPASTEVKILSWLDDLNKGQRGKIKNAQALSIFENGLQLLEPLSGDGLLEVAERWFELATKSV